MRVPGPLKWYYGDPDEHGEYRFCVNCDAPVWFIEDALICSGCDRTDAEILTFPVYLPGMRAFPFGIYPFYPDAQLEPYSTMHAACSYEARLPSDLHHQPRCGKPAVVAATDRDGTGWHRCWEHRELDYFGRPAIAVEIAWTPLPAWQR